MALREIRANGRGQQGQYAVIDLTPESSFAVKGHNMHLVPQLL